MINIPLKGRKRGRVKFVQSSSAKIPKVKY